jgi:cytoskeleton protein RodZ
METSMTSSEQSDSLTPKLGELLTAARENQKLSTEDAAKALRLNVSKINALESNDFSQFSDPTLLRALIRTYARFLKTDPEPLLEAQRQMMPAEVLNPIGISTEIVSGEIKPTRFDVKNMFFILLLAIILGIWLFNRQAPSDEDALEVDVASVDESTLMEQPATVQQPDVAKVDEPPAEVKASTSESQVSDVVKPLEKPTVVIPNAEAAKVTEKPAADKLAAEKQPSEKASPVKPVIEPAKIDAMKKVAVGSSLLRVKIVFTESAWVSVKDKSDNIVYEKLARAGDEDYAEGTPPLKFHVGNVSGTRLIYNGESVDLNAYAHANVARITLGGN